MSAIEGQLRHQIAIQKKIIRQQGMTLRNIKSNLDDYEKNLKEKGFERAKIADKLIGIINTHGTRMSPLAAELDGINKALDNAGILNGQKRITAMTFEDGRGVSVH